MTEFSNEITPSSEVPPPANDAEIVNLPPAKEAVLAALADEIILATASAKKASKESLFHYKTAGEKLIVAKDEAGHGHFADWAESKGFKRQWRSRLMHLAENWHLLDPFFHDDGKWPGKSYGVKEACGIVDGLLQSKKAATARRADAPGESKSEVVSADNGNGAQFGMTTESVEAETAGQNRSQQKSVALEPKKQMLAAQNKQLSADLKAAETVIEEWKEKYALLSEKYDALKAEYADLEDAKVLSGGFLIEKAAAATTTPHHG